MSYKKIIINKLFSCPPSKNYNNLMIDMESVSYISTPIISEIICSIIETHIPMQISNNDVTIFDATACVGGDTITFANTFGTVIAIEKDKKRYEMLINNLKEFELFNVVAINDDCLKIYKKINFIDIIYIDPPWGGHDYKYKKNLRLSIGEKYIDEIVNDVFNEVTRSNIKMIVLKLPKNYNLYEMYNNTKTKNATIYMYELTKMNVIVYKKNDYV